MYLFVLYLFVQYRLASNECVITRLLPTKTSRTSRYSIPLLMQAGKLNRYLLAVFFIKDQLNRDLTFVVIDLHLL